MKALYLDENGALSLMRTIIFSLLILVSKEKWLISKDRTLQWFLNYHQTVWFPDSLIHEQEMYLCSYLIWLFSTHEVLQKFLNLEGVYNALTSHLLFIMKLPLQDPECQFSCNLSIHLINQNVCELYIYDYKECLCQY